jgi:radical SAM protein with 4Fe4S-binding SPASM domain
MSKKYVQRVADVLQLYPDLELITFHGGEPFLFVKRMDDILQLFPDVTVGITTNGSLLKEHEWFLEKYRDRIRLNISYDFIYQSENRSELFVDDLIEVLRKHDIDHIWQYVLPIQDKRAFSLDNVQSIVRTMHRSGSSILNLIPLRHRRGANKFEVLLNDISMPHFADMFMRFITTLYNYNIRVFVDGNTDQIEKSYLTNHNKVILSPDGYMYPEYDFCEYKRPEFRVGQWLEKLEFNRLQDEENVIQLKCRDCSMRDNCGLKYLHKMFDTLPENDQCVKFYQIIAAMVDYTQKLYEYKNVYEAIVSVRAE